MVAREELDASGLLRFQCAVPRSPGDKSSVKANFDLGLNVGCVEGVCSYGLVAHKNPRAGASVQAPLCRHLRAVASVQARLCR